MQHPATALRDTPHASPASHLLADLQRLDALLRAYVAVARQFRPENDPYNSLYISEPQIDAVLAEQPGLPSWAQSLPPNAVDGLFSAHGPRTVGPAGEPSRLGRLQALFGLDPRDLDLLLIAFAPELSLKFEKLFAYLQDDLTKRRPSVDLALNLLSANFADKLDGLARLDANAKLIRHGLLELCDDPAQPKPPVLARSLRGDPRILAFLLGSDAVDPGLRAYIGDPGQDGAPPPVAIGLDDFLDRASALDRNDLRPLRLYLHGPAGVGKRSWARALCIRLDRPILVAEGAALALAPADRFEALFRAILREATLQDAVLFVRGFDRLLDSPFRQTSLQQFAGHSGAVILAGAKPIAAHSGLSAMVPVAIPLPKAGERLRIWQERLAGRVAPDAVAGLASVAAKFRLTGGGIATAADAALTMARWRRPEAPLATDAELHAACRDTTDPTPGERTRRIEPRHRWSDLVLPHDSLEQLREICDRVRHAADVLDGWGFGQKLSTGKGLSALFAGPSGTGKTMAAEIIANELGLHLYKIDLSNVVSKYIGETEKNLAHVFDEAETSSAILFFDEADALFGKRSEVKDAHDRYANVETSYLLQRMDDYQGISILATNLRRNMDDAFTRRLAFLIQFPVPESTERLRIWQAAFPSAVPLGPGVDLEFLAQQFKLPGGHIKNIVLAAAFLAASERTEVAMPHLLRATRRELQKIGKSCTPAEFGAYAHLLPP